MIKVLRVYLFMGYIRRFFSLLSILFGLGVLENGIFYSKANYIYILDTDGNIKDTVILNNTDKKVSGNISAEFYGGDERCLLIGFSTHDIKGLELSEEEQNLRIKLEDEVFKNKKGFVDVNVSAILDKSQIGSGNITLEPVTPE